MLIRVLSAVLLVAATGAGCTAIPRPVERPTPTSSFVPPTTPAMPYLTETPALEPTDRTTPPGTTLKFGEQAVVPFYSRYEKGVVGISFTVDTAPVTDADVDKLSLAPEDKEKLRGQTFFFVRERLENLDGNNYATVLGPRVTARTVDDGIPGMLLGMADMSVPGCPDRTDAPESFAAKGAVFEQCQLFFGTPDDPIGVVRYQQAPYAADDQSLSWRG